MTDLKTRIERNVFFSPDGCWLWTGVSRKEDGYGIIKVNRRLTRAHRVSYMAFKGPIPDGMFVCHSCDVRICVNPDHLFAGTVLDNNNDMIKKGRAKKSFGDTHLKAKIKSEDIPVIRELHRNGIGYAKIGRIYNVAGNSIRALVTGRTWKHIKTLLP